MTRMFTSQRGRPFAGAGARIAALFAFGLLALVAVATGAALAAPGEANGPIVCRNQTYALCAVAECRIYNGVSYCKCTVEKGNSISAPLVIDGKSVCQVNAQGSRNGFMVSTYSVPPEGLKPDGDTALYNCPSETSTGSYAQCDGGICFDSTRGETFPGFKGKLTKGEIICSCPITTANPSTAKTGYQIAGPYPCQKDFFKFCKKAGSGSKQGSTIYVGAPTGSAAALGKMLTGTVPRFNICNPS